MAIIVLCVVGLILFLLALGTTTLICFLAGETFSWGMVALMCLVMLIAAVAVGGGDGWE